MYDDPAIPPEPDEHAEMAESIRSAPRAPNPPLLLAAVLGNHANGVTARGTRVTEGDAVSSPFTAGGIPGGWASRSSSPWVSQPAGWNGFPSDAGAF